MAHALFGALKQARASKSTVRYENVFSICFVRIWTKEIGAFRSQLWAKMTNVFVVGPESQQTL
jgi:hypothetical protein